LKTRKKGKNMEIKDIFFNINPHLKDRLYIEITACYSELMTERALTSFTVSYTYRQFAGQA